jgi:hypothetical protein
MRAHPTARRSFTAPHARSFSADESGKRHVGRYSLPMPQVRLDGNALIAVEIDDCGAGLHAGATRRLFTMRRRPSAIAAMETKARYAVAPDGKRFLVYQFGEEPTVQTPIMVITTWRAMLR